MSTRLTFTEFSRQVLRVLADGRSLGFRAAESRLRALRSRAATDGRPEFRRHAGGLIARVRFNLAWMTGQPFAVVRRRYRRVAANGFRSLSSEVFATIHYADCCHAAGRTPEAVGVLQLARAKVMRIRSARRAGEKRLLASHLRLSLRRVRADAGPVGTPGTGRD